MPPQAVVDELDDAPLVGLGLLPLARGPEDLASQGVEAPVAVGAVDSLEDPQSPLDVLQGRPVSRQPELAPGAVIVGLADALRLELREAQRLVEVPDRGLETAGLVFPEPQEPEGIARRRVVAERHPGVAV